MQRRDFVRTALFGSGAVCSLALPSAYAALNRDERSPLRTSVARLETRDGSSRWRSLEHCSSDTCSAAQRVRVAIDALGFPAVFRGLAIDAMFDTQAGLRPFRIASHQPASLSPISKPFSFEADSASLAGFRAEHADTDPGSMAVAGSALLGSSRPVLAGGRYLLVISRELPLPDIESLAVPLHTADPIVGADGNAAGFGWLTFSVHPLIHG